MKKIFLLSIFLVLLTGCTSIENSSINALINNALNSNINTTNVTRNGYKYYLPDGMSIKNSINFNETLEDERYLYYLYVDIVSYHSKVSFSYKKNESSYYSSEIMYNGKIGYIEINSYRNNQYLIEIMYNYAKIEVVVHENSIKKSVMYAMSILTSITYNDNIIENYLGSTEFEAMEEKFDIFEIIGSDNYLEFSSDTEELDNIKDPDYIN